MNNPSPLFSTLSILLLPVVIILSLMWDHNDMKAVKSEIDHNNKYEFIR